MSRPLSFLGGFRQARLGKCYYQLGLLRDAEKQLRSALRQQEMLSTSLELAKVFLRLDQPAAAQGAWGCGALRILGSV